jgi:iron complex outermembrane receptor protein
LTTPVQRQVAIERGALDKALDKLARQYGVDLLYDHAIVRGRTASAVTGKLRFEAALAGLLAGSGISFNRTQDGVYVLRRLPFSVPSPHTVVPSPPRPNMTQELPVEIVVTARKRNELFSSLPLPITVLDAQRIAAIGARKALDIVPFSPGLFIAEQGQLRPGRVDTALRFRGMSVNTANPQEQLASVFVDGVYVSTGIQGIIMDDMERIEILNGPQSGVFGRSTFGGAVNFVTREPSRSTAGRLHMWATPSGDSELNASVEGPLWQDQLVGRVSIRRLRNSGDFRNPVGAEERLGRQSTDTVAGDLRLSSGPFKAAARLLYSRDRDGPTPGWAEGVFEHNCGPFDSGTRRTICGNLLTRNAARFGQNTRTVNRLSDGSDYGLKRSMWRGHLRLSLIVPGTNLEISSRTGFNHEDKTIITDGDFGPDPVLTQAYDSKLNDWSQEVRLANRRKARFSWSLGGNLFSQNYKETVTAVYDAFVNPFNYQPFCLIAAIDCDRATRRSASPEGDLFLGVNPFFSGKIRNRSVFASAEYEARPRLTVGLELRHEWDGIDAGTALTGMRLKKTFPGTLYRTIVSTRPTDRVTIYALRSTGNLPGGFNASVSNASDAVRMLLFAQGARDQIPQQRLRNSELGVRFGAPNLKFSLSAYYMLWDRQRIRRTFFNPETARTITYFDAAGSSVLKGVEFQSQWAPTARSRIELNANLASSRYRSQFSADAFRIRGNGDVAGNYLPSFPRLSGLISGSLEGQFPNGIGWNLRSDIVYRGKIYIDETNLSTISPRVIANLRGVLLHKNLRVGLFANNIFNSKSIDFASSQADISAYKPSFDFTQSGFIVSPTPPRKVGVELSTVF